MFEPAVGGPRPSGTGPAEGQEHVAERQREPIRYGWFWLGVLALVAGGSPWYLTPGSYEPVILGMPYWVWISAGLSLVFCLYVRWACLRLWSLSGGRDDADGSRDGEGD